MFGWITWRKRGRKIETDKVVNLRHMLEIWYEGEGECV
jgi:hypothetical protein